MITSVGHTISPEGRAPAPQQHYTSLYITRVHAWHTSFFLLITFYIPLVLLPTLHPNNSYNQKNLNNRSILVPKSVCIYKHDT